MTIEFGRKRSGDWVRACIVVLAIFDATLSVPAFAQASPPSQASGSIMIHQVQVAFIGSGTRGGGTLYYRGRAYPFKLGGLGIGGIGVSRLDAQGSVHNLRHLADFNGVYGQVHSGWAVGEQGTGKLWMKNANGVYLHLIGVRSGLSLTMGTDGVRVQLDR